MDDPCEELALKASPADQQLLLQVQQLDTSLDQLDYQEHSLPEHGKLVELDAQLAELSDEAIREQTEASDLRRDVAKAELEVEQVRKRIARDQELLDSGSITVSKQLEDLQHELATLVRRQRELEDAELEVLEVLEQTEKRLATIEAQRIAADAQRDGAIASRDATLATFAARRTDAHTERSGLVAGLPADVVVLYDKLRAANGGVGAAELKGGRCEGCRMQLPHTEQVRVAANEPDEIVRCEECRRILIRPAEISA